MKSNALKFITASFLGITFSASALAKAPNTLRLSNCIDSTPTSKFSGTQKDYNQAIVNDVILKINCGGDSVTENGITFLADNYSNGGRETSNDLGGAITDAEIDIYTTERSSINNANPNFGYKIPITNGDYTIKLHFAEIYFTGQSGKGANGSGRRVFDVILEGNTVLDEYDINADVGSLTAVVKTFENISISDGIMNIDFTSTINNPKISGIEILSSDGEIALDDCTWRENEFKDAQYEHIEGQSAVVDNKLYMFAAVTTNGAPQGSQHITVAGDSEVFDPNANTWNDIAPMPGDNEVAIDIDGDGDIDQDDEGTTTHAAMQTVGDEIWIIGGFVGLQNNYVSPKIKPGPSSKVRIYNTKTNTYREGPNLPFLASAGAATLVGDNLHYFGGLKTNDRDTGSEFHYYLDITNEAGGWIRVADMPNPRCHLGGTSVNGLVYAIGGQFGHDGGRTLTNLVHAYDPETDTWTQKADLPDSETDINNPDTGASHFEMGTITHNGKIMVAGGIYERREIMEYDPILDQWSEVCLLPSDTALTPTMFVHENKLIVTCGGLTNWAPTKKTRWIPIEPSTTVTPPTDDNLALNGIATQSTTLGSKAASRAIDGLTKGTGNSAFTAAQGPNAWWQVDIGSNQNIGDINIFNRTDNCCINRLSNFTVYVIDSNGNTTYSQTVTTTPDPSETVNASGALGQFVRIESNNTFTLNLAEVEVYGGTPTNTLTKIEAEDYVTKSTGPQIEVSSEEITNMGFITNNDYLSFNDIDLTGIKSFSARVSCKLIGGTIEARLGSTTGTYLGQLPVVNTGGNDNYVTVSGNFENLTSGINDVYFVFTGTGRWLFNVDWFELSTTTSAAKVVSNTDTFPIITAYPNPSPGLLTLENVPKNAIVLLSDLSGKTISVSETINDTTRVLDINTLNTGMYIISVNGITRTIIKE